MQINTKILTLATFLMTSVIEVTAQNEISPIEKGRHVLNISFSDGLTLKGAGLWNMGLSDVLTGTQRLDEKSTGVYGLGYRYTVNRRFKVGMDIGFTQSRDIIKLLGDSSPSVKEKKLHLMALPTVELVYFSRNLFQLYGSAAVGVDFTRYTEKGMSDMGMSYAQKDSSFEYLLAYQVNPVGIRVGNRRIAGFLETGLGFRGFVTAGISLGF